MMHAVFGVVGWKNCGKTTLTERLASEFTGRGLLVSTIKHAHHTVDVDQPGTDSYRHRLAGASEVLLAGGSRLALMREYRGQPEPAFESLLQMLSPVDLVLVEGFKMAPIDKIEVHRAAAGRPLWATDDPRVRLVASDVAIDSLGRPLFDLNDVIGIADAMLECLGWAK